MYVSLPTLDLPKIQDDSRLSSIGLQSIVFVYADLPLSCFTEIRICGFAQKRKAASVSLRQPADTVLRFHASAALCE
jgi:hypothetical protein